MAGRIFLTHIKLAMREREAIFWTLIFGIILGTLFYVAFHGIYEKENLGTISVAYVSEDGADTVQGADGSSISVKEMLETLTYEDGTPMLAIRETDAESAKALLDREEAKGVIRVRAGADGTPEFSLVVSENGISESVLTVIVGEYQASFDYLRYLYETYPDRMQDYLAKSAETKHADYVTAQNIAGKNTDPYVAYFYNLMAMVCMFCSIQSLSAMCKNQANIHEIGKRTGLAPVGKLLYELSALAAVYVVQLAASLLVLFYLQFVLKVEFGGAIFGLMLMTALGTLLGVSLGYMIAHIGTKGYQSKESILTAITLLGGFFAGLFYHSMKVIVEENNPILNRINPSAVITDAFYSLNVFGFGDRVLRSVITILVLSAAFLVIGSVLGRRQSYASL